MLHTTVDSEIPSDGFKQIIRCAVLDRSGKYLATSGDDKQLRLWEIDRLRLVNQRFVFFDGRSSMDLMELG